MVWEDVNNKYEKVASETCHVCTWAPSKRGRELVPPEHSLHMHVMVHLGVNASRILGCVHGGEARGPLARSTYP